MANDSFARASVEALADPRLRANFRRAMDGLMGKRAAQFPDPAEWQNWRARAARARSNALAKLPELLGLLEANCRRNGIQVHWAETTPQANAIVLAILKAQGATRVVKGKSMVSEEMHLNHFLEANGIEALETDLGEYIIQLDHETPSHIIMPAIHKNKDQIARLFAAKIKNAKLTEDVDELTAMARRVLRAKFEGAHAGLSGVNFAVAETGTLCLVENEGNGRMCTTVPPLHIAVMGLEKVVEKLADVPPLLAVLTRSATGQPISTYFNMITSPRKQGEKDGPLAVHLVILDNGRSRILGDKLTRDTLRCIRCGACMNHCPVYTRIGGHAYGTVYPGPIGKILMPQIEGLDQHGDLPAASTLCNACVEVCPVEIPIAEILVRLRKENVAEGGSVKGAGSGRDWREDLSWRGWRLIHRYPMAYRLFGRLLARLLPYVPASLPPLKAWTSLRVKPRAAAKSLHDRVREEGIPDA